MTKNLSPRIVDLDLARRIERAEGKANASCVEYRRDSNPAVGACWIEHQGTLAMFDGPESPLTQTFGLGMSGPISDDDLQLLEQFFISRGAAVHHEVCPLVDAAVQSKLVERGYRPIEWSNVLRRELQTAQNDAPAVDSRLRVRQIQPTESEAWSEVAMRGWNESPLPSEFMRETFLMLARREGSLCFVAEWEQTPIATASLFIADRIALFAGASTIPEARRRGAQRALFAARLQYARREGCELAVVVAVPGSASDRNAQASGFLTAYTRTKWCLPRG